MLTWWGELILIVVCFLGGYVVSFFVFRKNPKYLNVDRLIIDNMKEKRTEMIKAIQDKAKELK